ncbi:MAG: M18 family aminopeptidase [Acetatifactor sp.]|nr:M18 family aminopeptidase [Acetatifactor sp.]
MRGKMEGLDVCRDMLSFIEESPSCFHVVANLKEELAAAGFRELDEREDWRVCAGGSYYVTRNDSSLIAFRIPEGELRGFHMAASHSDSPTFKIKERPELEAEKHYVRLNTEKYGGMILSTWLDRPLSVAGRVTVCEEAKEAGNNIVTKLVNLDTDLLVIPNVAIHMNRDMNKGVEYNPQTDMLPLYGECGGSGDVQGMLREQVAEAAGVKPEDILGQDLFLYVRDKGRIFGREGEFVLSPRLDDLQCVYASMQAFLTSVPREYISLCAVFDNEEVGSGTRQGADSTFLEDVVTRVCNDLAGQNEKSGGASLKSRMLAGSFLISADNAHAVHPNHPELADPTNRPCLNGGIVIKYHGSQKYTTDAVSAAQMKSLCKRADVPYQTYANRSDIAGGSTLGNISAAHVSVSSVDIGLPQLAMHSAVETGGVRDTAYALRVLQEFFGE